MLSFRGGSVVISMSSLDHIMASSFKPFELLLQLR